MMKRLMSQVMAAVVLSLALTACGGSKPAPTTAAPETAGADVQEDGKAEIRDLAEYMGVTEKTVRNRVKEHGGFWISDSQIALIEKEKTE